MSEEVTDWAKFWGYSPVPLDLDAGIHRRSGVSMYKRMPGLYVNDNGKPVPDEMARDRGFDLEQDRREAQKIADIREAQQAVVRRYAEDIKGAREPFPVTPSPHHIPATKVVEGQESEIDGVKIRATVASGEPRETDDFAMRHIGGGMWSVVGIATGDVVLDRLDKQEAISAMVDLQKRLDQENAEEDS